MILLRASHAQPLCVLAALPLVDPNPLAAAADELQVRAAGRGPWVTSYKQQAKRARRECPKASRAKHNITAR